MLTDFDGFTACSGRSAFSRGAHGEGLCSGGANDHDVEGAAVIVGVGVYEVSAFGGTMCSGHELLSVDGGMPPLMKDSVEDIHDGVVATDGACAVSASDGVVSVGVTCSRAGRAV